MEELREAITSAIRCEAETSDGKILRDLILSEFVVVAARQGWDEDGAPVTQVVVMPDGDSPEHRIMGLLHSALLRFEADMLAEYRD